MTRDARNRQKVLHGIIPLRVSPKPDTSQAAMKTHVTKRQSTNTSTLKNLRMYFGATTSFYSVYRPSPTIAAPSKTRPGAVPVWNTCQASGSMTGPSARLHEFNHHFMAYTHASPYVGRQCNKKLRISPNTMPGTGFSLISLENRSIPPHFARVFPDL